MDENNEFKKEQVCMQRKVATVLLSQFREPIKAYITRLKILTVRVCFTDYL